MVDSSSLLRRGAPITFGIISLFSFIVAIIASILVHDYNTKDNAKDAGGTIKGRVRFFLFTGWFSFLFATAYLVAFLTGLGGVLTSVVSVGVFIFIDWVFWLSAAASLTAALSGGLNCSNNTHHYKYCGANNTLIAFGYILFILETFLLLAVGIVAAGAFRGGGIKETFGNRA